MNAATGEVRAAISSNITTSKMNSLPNLILTGSANTSAEIYVQSERSNKIIISKFVEIFSNASSTLELKWELVYNSSAYSSSDSSGIMLKISEEQGVLFSGTNLKISSTWQDVIIALDC
jgi:hypothetical protein